MNGGKNEWNELKNIKNSYIFSETLEKEGRESSILMLQKTAKSLSQQIKVFYLTAFTKRKPLRYIGKGKLKTCKNIK